MPSPPISPTTSLSPSGKMASLASILHHGSTPITTQSTSSKSTPAPSSSSAFRQATSPPPPHHHHSFGHHHHQQQQQPRSQATSPPPGFSNNSNSFITPLSPTTIASAGHRVAPVQEDLPFYHQLEQVQRVREGKFGAGGSVTAPSPLPPADFSTAPSSSGGGAIATAAAAAYAYSGDGGKNGFLPITTFERQISEVEEAKEVLKKAGALHAGGGNGPSPSAAAAWGSGPPQRGGSIGAGAFRGSIASGGGGQRGDDGQVKVQVQPDGKAMVRMMGSAEEADRDEGVRGV